MGIVIVPEFNRGDMQKCILLALLMICIGLVFSTGCTSTESTGTITQPTTMPTPTPQIIYVTVMVTPTATVSPTNTSVTPPPVTVQPTRIINSSLYRAAPDAPMINQITFSTDSWTLPDCYMQELFPDIVNNPDYGINASYANITALSAEQFNVIYREWNEGTNQNSKMVGADQCYSAPIYHKWGFVDIYATFTPRNARPANYEIATVVQGFGKDLGVFTTTQYLTMDKPNVRITSYIPLRSDQIGFISGVNLQFYKLSS
ncbi:MAG: hypothetical protein WC391_04685 [Methanoregula sp.]|jgi:hypothetical protein